MTDEQHRPPQGPYLKAAFFCERLLEDKEGVLSAIRIVDRIIFAVHGTPPSGAFVVAPLHVTLLVSLVSGEMRGSAQLRLRPETPEGTPQPELSFPIYLEGDERPFNLMVEVPFTAEHEGLYWFDVLLGDALLTRVPLRVVRQQFATGTMATSP